jgi:hypothetical protein
VPLRVLNGEKLLHLLRCYLRAVLQKTEASLKIGVQTNPSKLSMDRLKKQFCGLPRTITLT